MPAQVRPKELPLTPSRRSRGPAFHPDDRESAPTEVERFQEALVESEERYRSIVTAMSEGIVMQDASGRIVACNASAERILGLSREQLMGLTSFDPRWQATDEHGAQISGEDHPIPITMRTGQPLRDVVMGVRRADGSRVWVRVNTQPLFRPGDSCPYSVVASFADITESRHAEAVLQESEDRFRSLFEHSLDGVLLTAPDGAIFAVNPEGCRLLSRSEQEICEMGRAGIVDMTDPRLQPFLQERMAEGKARGELTLIRGDGSRFLADVSSAIFTDHDGAQRTSLSFRDISDRKRAEEALHAANEQLEARVAERTRQLAVLLEISRDVASELELRPLLAHILVELRAAIDYTGAAIAILENDAVVVLDYAGPAAREKVVGAHIPLDRDSGWRRVIERQAPVLVEDIWADAASSGTNWSVWDEAVAAEMSYARSWLGLPLVAKGKLIGLLRLDHREPGHFTKEESEHALTLAYQVAVAIANAQLHEAAQRAAALAERERVARELHDSVSQALYGIVLAIHGMQRRLGPDQEWIAGRLSNLHSIAETGLAEMRSLIFELRPDLLVTGGLTHALARHAELLRVRYGLEVDLRIPAEPNQSAETKEALYRIAQEASNNAARHAQGRRITIAYADMGSGFELEVVDDGQGFDVTQPTPGHMGLVSMRERAATIGANCEIASQPGRGTQVRVWQEPG